MKKPVHAVAILLFIGMAACGQPSNPLIGTWKVVAAPGGSISPYCATRMVFADKTQSITWPWADKPVSEAATYNAAQTSTYPTTVYVMGNSANHSTYNFTSKDKMSDSSPAGCFYARQ